jgi:hypothetical protein
MKYYLGIINQTLMPKNTLEKSIQLFFKNYDRMLITKKQIEDYKTEIISNIKRLVAEHPRCRPIDPIWFTNYDFGEMEDWILGDVNCIRFTWTCSLDVKR